MHLYELSPIDCFAGLKTLQEFLSDVEFTAVGVGGLNDPSVAQLGNSIIEFLIHCASLLGDKGLLGNKFDSGLREVPYVWPIPVDRGGATEMEYAIILKLDNNGTTFVCSPVEIPWLKGVAITGEKIG